MNTCPALLHVPVRPVPDNIIWLDPSALSPWGKPRPAVQVREIPPAKRVVTSSDENAELQNLIRQAPELFRRAKERGWVRVVAQQAGTYVPDKDQRSAATRRRMSQAAKRRAVARGFTLKTKRKTKPQAAAIAP